MAYPNPSDKGWQITLPETEVPYHLSLLDARGNEVWSGRRPGSFYLQNRTMSSGVYLLRVLGQGQSQALKLVKP